MGALGGSDDDDDDGPKPGECSCHHVPVESCPNWPPKQTLNIWPYIDGMAVTVQFAGGQTKTLNVEYARLEKIT